MAWLLRWATRHGSGFSPGLIPRHIGRRAFLGPSHSSSVSFKCVLSLWVAWCPWVCYHLGHLVKQTSESQTPMVDVTRIRALLIGLRNGRVR